MELGGNRASPHERESLDDCERICARAFQVIRTSAFRRSPCDAPEDFEGDYVEWIRLVADACDGLARPSPTAKEALTYRRQIWNDVQRAWIDSVLNSETPVGKP
jgi:hypothetical protein